ncbi:class I SAM-dependent methyltransferase [Paenarthrobacter sp. JL.01a]|uniref:class I SAM-dependent methyltransferase n=1 Tax=Paenarthrobacter sp. JL.01a TaxID=2979324 RepID=UPI0021CA4415|nr:class I SAM-dependent methyltransferase [Paenarthrobacter sp. JL.01a]UXM91095.1 class I SAM-dependent methyltransferase [Paenarthrobacter sp. JL.01a]
MGGGKGRRDLSGTRLYDHIIANSLIEIPEILAAAAETTGAVLELARGSGRLTKRAEPTGRETVARHPSDPQPEHAFGCVILGASYATLLDPGSRRTLFRKVNQCLAPGGRFLMTVLNPDHRHASMTTNNGATISQLGEDSFLITVESRDALNGARQVSTSHVSFNEHGTYRSSAYSCEVAFVSTLLIEEDLAAEGFTVLDRRPIRADSQEEGIDELELWVCAARQQATAKAEERP